MFNQLRSLFGVQWNNPQYACKACETVSAAPIPPAIIDGGMAAPGLLSWVLTSKYMNHLPLYRLEQIAAREQVGSNPIKVPNPPLIEEPEQKERWLSAIASHSVICWEHTNMLGEYDFLITNSKIPPELLPQK